VQKRTHRVQQFSNVRVLAFEDLIVGAFRRLTPMPSVFERFYLRMRLLAGRCLEQDIVGRLRIERRIEVDEINRFVFDAISEND
jgi:hypothetical protein